MKIKKSPIPIVGIHGWQGNRKSFNSVAELFKINHSHWFFPQAPYEIKPNQFTWAKKINEGVYEIAETKKYLKNFFYNNIFTKFNPKEVHVVGFSQGATICFEFVLKLPVQFAGVYPVSGFLRDYKSTVPRLHPKQIHTPILIGHGKEDRVISVNNSKRAYEILKKETDNVDLHLYNGGHKIGISYIEKAKNLIMETNE